MATESNAFPMSVVRLVLASIMKRNRTYTFDGGEESGEWEEDQWVNKNKRHGSYN